jgi:hypothetical protein
MFSIVLNVQVVDSMKYLPVLLSPIYPLGTYVIVKNLKFSNSQSIMKYALFISSIPISIENYIVTGSQFGVLLAFFALTGLSMLVRRNDRRYLLVFVLSVFGLAVAHSPSSFLLTIFLLTALAIQRIPLSQMMSSLRVPVILAVTSICTTWLMFPARYTFETIVRLGFLRVQGEGAESVPPRFLELARVNMLGAFNTLLATDGAEIFLLLLASTGLIILLRTWKHLEKTSRSFLVVGATVFLFIPLGGLLSIGVFRIVFFASTLFPIFASILFVEYEGKRAMRLRKVVLPSIVLLILLSAALGLYGCQPLIPSASILLKDLPVDQPLGYVTSVNSIYQRQMIEFAQNNVAGQIACDSATGDQITGLTDLNFSANHLTYYYPLDKKQPAKDYSYFLIHVPGIAGPFSNSAETRTRDMILTVINNSSNIYTNGESYILLNQTMVAQP